jgi:hypothetical protein
VLVDSCFDTYLHGYTLTQVHHRRGRVLRVRIRRDQRASKSFALVEVLTPCWAWTELASEPPSRWHVDTPPVQCADQETLTGIVEVLLERAAAILAPPDPTG